MNILIRENLHKPRAIEQEGQSNLWVQKIPIALDNGKIQNTKFKLIIIHKV